MHIQGHLTGECMRSVKGVKAEESGVMQASDWLESVCMSHGGTPVSITLVDAPTIFSANWSAPILLFPRLFLLPTKSSGLVSLFSSYTFKVERCTLHIANLL